MVYYRKAIHLTKMFQAPNYADNSRGQDSEIGGCYQKRGIFLERDSYSIHHDIEVLNVIKVKYKLVPLAALNSLLP